MRFTRPVPLTLKHDIAAFSCGVTELDLFLKKHALQSQTSHASRTYACLKEEKVIGYYTLSFGSVLRETAPERILQGMGKYPIPVMALARLAVDEKYQGIGLGESLLKDAFIRTVNASRIAGLRALIVVAKNKKSREFYKKYGFIESPIDALHLFILMKDIIKNLS